MCEYYNQFLKLNYKSLMPPNLYGPNDNYSLNNSHFYPALLKKIFNAKTKNLKTLEIWGSGKVKRELMFYSYLKYFFRMISILQFEYDLSW